jgi:hypothetical protein
MENIKLSKEQYQAYNVIELSILFQRSIEILDELNAINHPIKNKALASQLKAIYPSLDKQTKLYNEMYNVEQEGVSHFYDITKKNAEYIMNFNLLDKALICSFLVAHEIDSKAVEGIINKVIKRKK